MNNDHIISSLNKELDDLESRIEDLSKKYGISRERVRQIETESMSKLKENL